MTITTTYTFLTFEQWKQANPDIQEEMSDCPDCLGTGECSCTSCGNEHDCESCGGTGEICEDGTLEEQYKAQLRADKDRVARYLKTISPEEVGA